MSVYDFSVKKANGASVNLADYKGKVLLIVNTATKCGLAPQLRGLEELHKKYAEKGLAVLGFPCSQFAGQELDDADEIHAVCQMNYGVTFQFFDKIDVNGKTAHPLFAYLRKKTGGLFGNSIKWNFTKFLIDAEGKTIQRFAPATVPAKMEQKIAALLG